MCVCVHVFVYVHVCECVCCSMCVKVREQLVGSLLTLRKYSELNSSCQA